MPKDLIKYDSDARAEDALAEEGYDTTLLHQLDEGSQRDIRKTVNRHLDWIDNEIKGSKRDKDGFLDAAGKNAAAEGWGKIEDHLSGYGLKPQTAAGMEDAEVSGRGAAYGSIANEQGGERGTLTDADISRAPVAQVPMPNRFNKMLEAAPVRPTAPEKINAQQWGKGYDYFEDVDPNKPRINWKAMQGGVR